MSDTLPPEYRGKKGSTYETRYLYTGLSRYDVEKKTISQITQDEQGRIFYRETPYAGTVFSRGYATEMVRVTIFSESPRVWMEEVSPHEMTFFQQAKQPA